MEQPFQGVTLTIIGQDKIGVFGNTAAGKPLSELKALLEAEKIKFLPLYSDPNSQSKLSAILVEGASAIADFESKGGTVKEPEVSHGLGIG